MGLRPDDAHAAGESPKVALEEAPATGYADPDTMTPTSSLSDGMNKEPSTPTLHPPSSAASLSLEDSAFASWCGRLNATIQDESRALKDQVLELQKEFDDTSQYIRGDFAWRKQVAAFHDRTNDVVASVLQTLTERLQQNTQSLSVGLADTLKVKEAQAKDEMQRQVCMYEDKLRRTRTSLKKEIDRFTHLEKCLRKEETHQAKAMYDRLVHQLTLEYAAKEATLQAMLRELKLSYVTIENANTQLMDAVKSKDGEIEQLKKLLPKTTASVQRGPPTTRLGSAATTSAPAAAVNDAYVQSLKQSLQSANTTLESLRKQAEEVSSDKETALKRQRQAEDAATRTNEELTKVKTLLSESHSALVANRKEMETVLQEKIHWKELYADLHFQSGSHEHALDDTRRLADVAQAQVESLQLQLRRKRGAVDTAELVRIGTQWRRWRECGDESQPWPELLQLMDRLVSQTSAHRGTDDPSDETNDFQRELETKLRFEFEAKYGDMLNLRVSHERKRVLARIEMLWLKRAEETTAAMSALTKAKRLAGAKETRRPQQTSTGEATRGATLRQVLQLVAEAFHDLGFSDWASTDIDLMHDEIARLRGARQAHEKAYSELQAHAEAQAVSMARTDLLLREKEMLLAEVTDRYRVVRAYVENLRDAHDDGGAVPAPLDLSHWDTSDPFTVYGHPQPIEEKRRPSRVRPVSASATLTNATARLSAAAGTATSLSRPGTVGSTGNRGLLRHPAPKSFLLNQLPDVMGGSGPTTSSSLSVPLQQQEDHVRSVLKADLLSLTPAENQLEDGSHVGADGILQIMQRRRHRK